MTPTVRTAGPAAALAAFVLLGLLSVGDGGPLAAADAAAGAAARGFGERHPGVVAATAVLTDVAATVPYLLGLGVAAAVLAARGRRRAAGWCAAVAVVVPALWAVLHVVLPDPRPPDGFVRVDSFGFPSGHTTNATAAALVAVALLWPGRGRRARVWLTAAAVAFAVLVGATRVVLLAHWPSQVVGGWLLGLGLVPLLRILTERAISRFRPSLR